VAIIKILLAGDSWAWAWVNPQYTFNSKEFNDKIDCPYREKPMCNFPQMKLLLEALGHDVTVIALPGESNSSQIEKIKAHTMTNSYDQIWFLFTHPTRDYMQPHDNSYRCQSINHELFVNMYNDFGSTALRMLRRLANTIQTPILLAGGCGKIPRDNFDLYCNSGYMHLVTESIIERFTSAVQTEYTLCGWNRLVELGFIDNIEFADKVLDEEDLYTNSIHTNNVAHFFWPDTGHPGITGQTLIVDMFFSYIEDQLTPLGSE